MAVGLAGVLLYFALRGVEWKRVGTIVSHASIAYSVDVSQDTTHGYDHKYIYSHVGYNLKVTDMQAAVGVAQLKKLPGIIEARKRNFAYLKAGLKGVEEHFVLPEATPNSDPSWFGFPLRYGRELHSRVMRSLSS